MEPLAPGKSLESDLRLIREERGFSREEIFNRVHIRPEVLAQVEEHGFGATPTLSSDIHRRSFVKHYADAIEIDGDIALAALQKSLTGFYDGSLAVEYLGLAELKSVPRWAQQPEEHADEATGEPDDVDFNVVPDEPPQPEFDIPVATEIPVFPAPEPESEPESEPELEPELELESEPEPQPELESEPEHTDDVAPTPAAESELEEQLTPEVEPIPATDPEPDVADVEEPEAEAPDELPKDIEVVRVSPYAPPKMMSASYSEDPPSHSPPPPTEPETPVVAFEPEVSEPAVPPTGVEEPLPQPTRGGPKMDPLQDYNIPSSTMKESVIGPPSDDDYGDEETLWAKLRGQHWLAWIGLMGVVAVLAIVVGQTLFGEEKKEPTNQTGFATVEDLPDQFSGIIRLTPTTERYVNLQILPDSMSTTEFTYKMWTDSEGAIYAEIGQGRLNANENQVLLGEPYGVGGVFILEGGAVRIRSVRRIRFPRWEFTGLLE